MTLQKVERGPVKQEITQVAFFQNKLTLTVKPLKMEKAEKDKKYFTLIIGQISV